MIHIMSARWPALPGRPKVHLFDVYPELRPIGNALRRGDWSQVAAAFDYLPAGTDEAGVVNAVVDVKGSETFLQRMVNEQESPLPYLLLAARYITIAWQIRGRQTAQHVSQEQFAGFHDFLRRAERVLSGVTAAEPGNTTAWALRLPVARGLRFGLEEARRRYALAACGNPAPAFAQRQLLQQLCPKWGGSLEEVHQFTEECLEDAPGGSLSGALVAEGHLEHLAEDPNEGAAHLRQPHVIKQLQQAADQSVLHPDFQPVYGWVSAHNTFAFLWWGLDEYSKAATHFHAVGNRIGGYPWDLSPTPVKMFRQIRRESLARAR
jgi:hypothetical protein